MKSLIFILSFVFLSGCSFLRWNRTGQNKNAPIFVKPNTNENVVNKSGDGKLVEYKAEKYVLIKESDLNLYLSRKVNESGRNKAEPKPQSGEKSPTDPELVETPQTPPQIPLVEQNEIPTLVLTEKPKDTSFFNNKIFGVVVTIFILLLFVLVTWNVLFHIEFSPKKKTIKK